MNRRKKLTPDERRRLEERKRFLRLQGLALRGAAKAAEIVKTRRAARWN